MIREFLLILFCVQSPTMMVDSARILGIFPIPSISHQVVFRALMLELGRRGHELVIITPNPALPKERPPDNITEIDTGQAYQLMARLLQEVQGNKTLKRGVVMDIECMFTGDSVKGMMELISYQFELGEVKKILDDKSQKFDLVFVEAIANYHLVVSNIFNAPAILFSSFYGFPEHYDILGAVAWHPIFYPNFYRHKYKNLSFWEKIEGIYLEWKIFRMIVTREEKENDMLKRRFGPEAPTIEDMRKNIQMLFVNSHPIFGNNRPVPPSVVYLGALHLQPVKELPQDLKTYLDESTRGVVYVSLGTNVRPSMMEEDFLNAFLDAFEALPYDILWKFDGDHLDRIPENLRIQKWFPQRDLLMHPNIKVFVTQGGLQSTDEAIDAAVPLVGIPMLGDQWYNVNKYVELGIGEQIDALTMTGDDLVAAVKKVIANDKYRKNIRRLRSVMNDQPQRPLERAVWWTEHVLRHGGADHLRAPSANTAWSEYYMTDVIILLVGIVAAIISLIIYTCCRILHAFKRMVIKFKQS
ncbi:UDP-glucosyltransferase 2-like [Anticarsia gemmatalis]|uniref:UDP-glucosyltransferase 2-like n=1 Tax=Anticarsia gemmatalis TaxID=129554 RepID=UPI003F775177